MLVEFRNVTIGIEANTPAEAYAILAQALCGIPGDYQTDTYVTYPEEGSDQPSHVASEERPTQELWPK